MGIKQILKAATSDALKDRNALLDAYAGCDDDMVNDIKQQINKIKSWKYKPSSKWTNEDKSIVFLIFIYAEQHQESWAAANACSSEIKKEALEQLKIYKDYRILNIGKSKLESLLEDPKIKAVNVNDLVKSLSKPKGMKR